MILQTEDDDLDPHGLDQFDRESAIAQAVIAKAQESPAFARRLETFLDRVIFIAEDRELLGLRLGCLPTRNQYGDILMRDLENAQLELAEIEREIKALEASGGIGSEG